MRDVTNIAPYMRVGLMPNVIGTINLYSSGATDPLLKKLDLIKNETPDITAFLEPFYENKYKHPRPELLR